MNEFSDGEALPTEKSHMCTCAQTDTHTHTHTNTHTHTHIEGKGEREGERRMERELFLAPDPARPDLALSL